jgi:hypothetical protein
MLMIVRIKNYDDGSTSCDRIAQELRRRLPATEAHGDSAWGKIFLMSLGFGFQKETVDQVFRDLGYEYEVETSN